MNGLEKEFPFCSNPDCEYSSSGRAIRASCPPPAPASQAREPDSPSGLRPLPLPVAMRAGDPGVMGSGNWAELPDGRIVGRSIYSGVYLCDVCAREWRAIPIFAVAISALS
jgi:hypothetical protein